MKLTLELPNRPVFVGETIEATLTWMRVKDVVLQMREARKNPLYLKNLEILAEKNEQWLTTRAPAALEETRKIVAGMAKQAGAAAKK